MFKLIKEKYSPTVFLARALDDVRSKKCRRILVKYSSFWWKVANIKSTNVVDAYVVVLIML